MIKKLKFSLISFAVLALVGIVGVQSASADPLTFSNDTAVRLGNGYNLVIKANSTATSVVADVNTLTVTVPALSTFIVSSPDGYSLANDGSLTPTCNGTAISYLTIVGSPSTVVITPAPSACPPTNVGGSGLASGGSTGGSSGGGSSYVPPATTTPTLTITPPTQMVVTQSIPGCSSTVGYSTVTGVSCANNVGYNTPSTSSYYNLGTVTLKSGSKGDAVKELQRFLNDKLNLGLVLDGKLGPKTIAVIKKWQKANGLVADGLIGAKTKAKMNSITQ